MLEELLDHKCDIYHQIAAPAARNYGLPSDEAFSYLDTPDVVGQRCHFSVKTGQMQLSQAEPQNELTASLKMTFPAGVDVRANDKIVDLDTGYEYVAEIPRNIRDHHITVWIHRVHPLGV